MLKRLLTLAVLLVCAINSAGAFPFGPMPAAPTAQDSVAEGTSDAAKFLATVKLQTATAKTTLSKVKGKALADIQEARKLTSETRVACEELVQVAQELFAAEAEAKKQALVLKKAEAEAAQVANAARVRKVQQVPPMEESIVSDRRRIDWTLVDEQPSVTRARVVKVCESILSQPAPAAPEDQAPQSGPAPAGSSVVPFRRW